MVQGDAQDSKKQDCPDAKRQIARQLKVKSAPNTSCFVHFDFKMCVSPQRHAIFARENFQKCSHHEMFCTFSLRYRTDRPCFHISTSENVPNTTWFVHANRQIFRHLKFKKCAETQVFCTFSLANVLRATAACNFFDIASLKKCSEHLLFCAFSLPNARFATAACNFCASELPQVLQHEVFCTFSLPDVLFATAACNFSRREQQKVLSDLQFFSISTSECAFRHSGVQFFEKRTAKSALGPSVF